MFRECVEELAVGREERRRMEGKMHGIISRAIGGECMNDDDDG